MQIWLRIFLYIEKVKLVEFFPLIRFLFFRRIEIETSTTWKNRK